MSTNHSSPVNDTDLRLLVDIVWNHATESTAVPSTKTADMLIAKYRLCFGAPAQRQPGLETFKLTYIKRWRTLVNLPAEYAAEIVEALRAPAVWPTGTGNTPQDVQLASLVTRPDGGDPA